MTSGRLAVHVDESGQRGRSPKASQHFILSAAMVPAETIPEVERWLADLKVRLGRRPTDTLHFQNLKKHSERVAAAKALGAMDDITLVSVVVCKNHLPAAPALNDDEAYLYTLRLLLERVSWLARDWGMVADYTLAHIVRFPKSKLRTYEAALRATPRCQIEWAHLDRRGGRIDQPSRVPLLQVADLAASATAQAFEPDAFGNTEPRYLMELLPRVWARGRGANRLTSYGLKMHPWSDSARAAYPWVAAL